ncbi:MAG: PIG-L family deacetylase, partial [Anaerolineae bacterium]
AHPDDEILGPGGTLAHYAMNGTAVELICATRGEAGEIADPALATPETLGAVREQEMRCAAKTLGVAQVTFLGFRDSGMDGSDDNQHPQAFVNAAAEAVVPQIVAVIRRFRPQVVMTFEPWGGYGHPDHIAINRHTHAAITAAADPAYRPNLGQTWAVARLFYELLPVRHFEAMQTRMASRGLDVNWFENLQIRREKGWPDDNVQCIMDVRHTVAAKWAAFNCHRTQFGEGNLFRRLPAEEMQEILSREYFALALPEPAPDLRLHDLFAGLNGHHPPV